MIIEKWEYADSPPMELLLSADPSEEHIGKYLVEGQCYVAREANETLGVFVLLPLNKQEMEIVNIAVSVEEQGKGIGKSLVKRAIQIAKEQGYSFLKVGTGNSSVDQLAYYQKCGFRIVGVDIDYFTRNYAHEIVENGIVCRDMVLLEMNLAIGGTCK
ncbi:GNAT family N-acetyltransferase [Oceanobacillus bengalensis]|uniref:GNAT family N-acetyltransferase n=1 Tax=Oceanobacillus bengalensis TaxID=1435466 RepID=A0A494Z8L0_9BACI|nr:GNAT family N-acetyltransferase [Oceanobacillus bengalensis]RKQ18678.1 GNAT family N-acetyltransferase [Oceanobacillus bengalensis]